MIKFVDIWEIFIYLSIYFQRFKKNGGKCGTCGDPYDDPHPEHEAGGRFATGSIVRYYPEATSHIPVTIDVTAHHKGKYTLGTGLYFTLA